MDRWTLDLKNVPISILIDSLAKGWQASHCGLVEEFVARIGEKFRAHCTFDNSSDNAASFTIDLGYISLRGMDRKQCLVLGSPTVPGLVNEFYNRADLGRVPFVFAISDAAYRLATTSLP